MLQVARDTLHDGVIIADGLGKLITNATMSTTKTGRPMWRGFVNFDYSYPKEKQAEARAMGVLAFGELASKLTEWPKGTLLHIKGTLAKNDYMTKRDGKERWQIMAEYVHDQHNYNIETVNTMDEYETGTVGEQKYEDYDPGF